MCARTAPCRFWRPHYWPCSRGGRAGAQVVWSGIVGQQIRHGAWIVHAPDGDFVFEAVEGRPGSLDHVVVKGTPGRERRYDFDGVRDVPKLSGRVWVSTERDPACSLEP